MTTNPETPAKVYLVTTGSGEPGDPVKVYGVTLSRKIAEALSEKLNETPPQMSPVIEEWNLLQE